jgi:hypothetical protein
MDYQNGFDVEMDDVGDYRIQHYRSKMRMLVVADHDVPVHEEEATPLRILMFYVFVAILRRKK